MNATLPRTEEGQVALPPRITKEMLGWWVSLGDQGCIIAALEAVEYHQRTDKPTSVAEKPWKWIAEAYALRPQAECYVCTHLKEQHEYEAEGCQVEDGCDCRAFEPFPVESEVGVRS